MELKRYQRRVLGALRDYLRRYASCGDAATAYNRHLASDGILAGEQGVPRYCDTIPGVPCVCIKVPTGGGKTFIAANALGVICDELPERPADVVVWFVPRKEILRQTLGQLQNPSSPLRLAIDRDFAHRVAAITKEDGLLGRGFTLDVLEDQLTVFVLSYDSFKNKNRDDLLSRKENSAMVDITAYQRETGQAVEVPGADETALITALAGTNPIIVVDESHHAKSDLSVDMLRSLNPRFVLELTATPRKGSNVIARATAAELKDEQMVKLPVIIYRRKGKREVVQDALLLQQRLEQIALAEQVNGGDYIRPIALLQAQQQGADDAETYERLKRSLLDAGVPEERVAIRTGNVDELKGVDLMSEDCPVRFIITVEALAEGWDCPFAYILASVANKNSKVSVEQIVGRVLRQPYAHRSTARSLNISYVLTSSDDFNTTALEVIRGLNGAGFSKRDVVSSNGPFAARQPVLQEQPSIDGFEDAIGDEFEFSYPTLSTNLNHAGSFAGSLRSNDLESSIDNIIDDAEDSEAAFEMQAKAERSDAAIGSTGVGDGVNTFMVREQFRNDVHDLSIPQFRVRQSAGLFSAEETLPFEWHMLLDTFDLTSCGTEGVSLDEAGVDDVRQVDIDAESGEFKVRELSAPDIEHLRALFCHYTDDAKREQMAGGIFNLMSPRLKDTYGSRGLKDFIGRVVAGMTSEQVDAYVENGGRYARAIANAVKILAERHCKKAFSKRLATGSIVLEPTYKLPDSMIVRAATTIYDSTLYEAECGEMNGLEERMAFALSASPRIRWWHRIDERRKDSAFCINGYINHYPDFLAMTEEGRLLTIEMKGEQLKNDDSRDKLDLGTKWALASGPRFSYFMVFDHDALEGEGSYVFDEFKSEVLNG